jgi:alpha-glucoside transport system substrate-binding protein
MRAGSDKTARVGRRTALKALALPAVTGLTGLGAAGCGTAAPSLNVAVVWTDWELRQFQKVLDKFTARTQIRCQLLSMGDDTGAFLGNEVTAAAQPDVALVPAPGTVLSNRGRLTTVPWPVSDASSWRGLLAGPGPDPAEYGVWFKAANKSMVWHTTDVTPPPGSWDWDTWTAWCKTQANAGRPPLAIGAADGWVLADWFSNVLLAFHPDTYQQLVAAYREVALGHSTTAGTAALWKSADVADALHELACLWRTKGLFPGGAERALVTQFDQSVLDVFAAREAAMVVGADYYWPIITQYTRFPPSGVRWFPFPGAAGGQSPVILAGDAAVQFARPGRDQYSQQLIRWLSDPEAARIWAGVGGFLSISHGVADGSYTAYLKNDSMQVPELIASVRRPDAEFSMADLLSGPLSGGDGAGAWKIFTDFFTDVAVRRIGPGAAVSNAVTALAKGEGGA